MAYPDDDAATVLGTNINKPANVKVLNKCVKLSRIKKSKSNPKVKNALHISRADAERIFENKITDEAFEAFRSLVESARKGIAHNPRAIIKLPEKPVRDYDKKLDENIISYLRSEIGFAPWLENSALSRPLLRKLAPKAYMALANWLKRHKLPADIVIPTKSELIDKKISDRPDILSEGVRLARVQHYRLNKR